MEATMPAQFNRFRAGQQNVQRWCRISQATRARQTFRCVAADRSDERMRIHFLSSGGRPLDKIVEPLGDSPSMAKVAGPI
jgi:hypothetical protein